MAQVYPDPSAEMAPPGTTHPSRGPARRHMFMALATEPRTLTRSDTTTHCDTHAPVAMPTPPRRMCGHVRRRACTAAHTARAPRRMPRMYHVRARQECVRRTTRPHDVKLAYHANFTVCTARSRQRGRMGSSAIEPSIGRRQHRGRCVGTGGGGSGAHCCRGGCQKCFDCKYRQRSQCPQTPNLTGRYHGAA
jgi:hypothetical protein